MRTSVRARFEIAPDGSFQVSLLSSTGNPDLDAITLATLRRWHWSPALQNGKPVPSAVRLRLEFVVE